MSAVITAEPGIPAGNLAFDQDPEPSPRRLVIQSAIVVGAALLVGLVVFVVVRAAVSGNSGPDAGPEPIEDIAIVDPGPSNERAATEDSSRSGARRSSADDGEAGSSAFASGATEVSLDTPASPSQDSASAAGSSGENESDDPGNRSSGASETTVDPRTTTANSTAKTSAAVSPRPSAPASPSSTTTTASSTTTATSAPPTTPASVPPPTKPPAPPKQFIAAPTDGSRWRWEASIRFRVTDVPGAEKYCWAFSSYDSKRRQCTKKTLYELPRNPGRVSPGPVTVDAVAYAKDGSVLASQRISIRIVVGDFLKEPDNGEEYEDDDRLRFRSDRVETADNYCWTLTQGALSTGKVCDPDGRLGVGHRDVRRLGFVEGKARVRATAYRGSQLVADQSVTIIFE